MLAYADRDHRDGSMDRLKWEMGQLEVISHWIAYWLKNDLQTYPEIVIHYIDGADDAYCGPILIIPESGSLLWGIGLDAQWRHEDHFGGNNCQPPQRKSWPVVNLNDISDSERSTLVRALQQHFTQIEKSATMHWPSMAKKDQFDPRFHLELIVSELERIQDSFS